MKQFPTSSRISFNNKQFTTLFDQCRALWPEIMELYVPFSNTFRDFGKFESQRFKEYTEKIFISYVPDGRLVDLGAGTNALNVLLHKLGMEVHIVDDFNDYNYGQFDTKGFLKKLAK